MDENMMNSFDLCAGCAQNDLDVPDEDFTHKTSHNFFKSLRILSLREVPTVNRLAKQGVTAAAERFSKQDADSAVCCLACGQQVSRPCWYCVECTDVGEQHRPTIAARAELTRRRRRVPVQCVRDEATGAQCQGASR